MNRKLDLLKYLPEFMQQFSALKQITEAESKALQTVLNQLNTMDNNQFILTADSDGLKRYEKMLGITVLEGEALESRKKKVLMKWNNQDSYTYSTFLKKLEFICGVGNYQVAEHFKQYVMQVVTDLKECGEMAQLENMIDDMLPCNIVMHLANEMHWHTNGFCGMNIISTVTEIYECSDNVKEKISGEGNLGFGGAAASVFIIDTRERQ